MKTSITLIHVTQGNGDFSVLKGTPVTKKGDVYVVSREDCNYVSGLFGEDLMIPADAVED